MQIQPPFHADDQALRRLRTTVPPRRRARLTRAQFVRALTASGQQRPIRFYAPPGPPAAS